MKKEEKEGEGRGLTGGLTAGLVPPNATSNDRNVTRGTGKKGESE